MQLNVYYFVDINRKLSLLMELTLCVLLYVHVL